MARISVAEFSQRQDPSQQAGDGSKRRRVTGKQPPVLHTSLSTAVKRKSEDQGDRPMKRKQRIPEASVGGRAREVADMEVSPGNFHGPRIQSAS